METYVSLKVEGTERARSHPSRTDRWNEDFEIQVDKANEVEITVYDKQMSESYPVPIGMLWIRINDLVEAQRRQKVEQEAGQGGWVTAAAAGAMAGGESQPYPASPGHSSAGSGDFNNALNMPGAMPGGPSMQPEGIDGWFAVEPAGAISLRLNFGELSALCHSLNCSCASSEGECSQAAFGCPRSRSAGCCSSTQGRSA